MHPHTTPTRSRSQRPLVAAPPTPMAGAMAVSPLLGVDEVAALLGVPRPFVYALARRGELPTVRVGDRYVRFRAETLYRWIADQESTRPKGTQ